MVNYKFISYQWQIRVATGQFGSVREIFQSKTIYFYQFGLVWFLQNFVNNPNQTNQMSFGFVWIRRSSLIIKNKNPKKNGGKIAGKLFGAPLHNSPVDHIFIYEAKGSSADLSQGREAAHDVERSKKVLGLVSMAFKREFSFGLYLTF